MNQTETRKDDHIRICLEREVESEISTGFEQVRLPHRSLPELSYDQIDLSTTFLGKELKFPLQISGMTGGSKRGKKINKNLAEAAEELGIAMGVGSQRAAIEKPELSDTFSIARITAPDSFLIGNIGAVQLNYGYTVEDVIDCKEMIEANAVAIHLNPAQEIVQPEGDYNFSNLASKIKRVSDKTDFPLIAKEAGFGVSGKDAERLEKSGVDSIDVQGAGGTSWSVVESLRSNSDSGDKLRDWGIPTRESLRECKENTELPLIASGGIRNGFDVAKSIAAGAEIAGLALPLLKPATISSDKVLEKLNEIIRELKTAMFLTGSKNIKQLSDVDLISEE